ncbi:MAG: DUF1499 domain-containing protein [Pseudomonadales bacterium]|nr:DUF1499 domain-containing protein [Pseudomonadales bacterium]
MEETLWWSKLLLISAAIAVFLLVVSPLGYKYGSIDLMSSLGSLMLAIVVALLVLFVSFIMLYVCLSSELVKDRNLLLVAIGLSMIPLVAVGPLIIKASNVPRIHDISTDTESPPIFHKLVALREGAPNGLEYELKGSAEELKNAQLSAYPELAALESKLAVPEAVQRAENTLLSMGLELVHTDVNVGVVEAVATSYWFGFKDDLVVRIRPQGSGSVIDLRSVSRVGQSDLGANATRILKFIAAFDADQ